MKTTLSGALNKAVSEVVHRLDVRPVWNDSGIIAESRWACPAAHISPRWAAVVGVPESARAIELTSTCKEPNLCETIPHIRGCVTSFSKASRRRLLWLTAKIAESHLANSLFLTLTYPAQEKGTARPKRDIDTFLKRLARRSPSASGIWKLEYTKAGTPHFHMLLLGVHSWPHRALADCWADVVRSSHPSHRRAGTRIERPRSPRHTAAYVSKYLAKATALPAHHQGRCWGKLSNIATFFSPVTLYTITLDQLKAVRRMLDRLRLAGNRTRPFRRLTCLSDSRHWFASGTAVGRYLTWLGAVPLSECPP